jgi:hypothetical protein
MAFSPVRLRLHAAASTRTLHSCRVSSVGGHLSGIFRFYHLCWRVKRITLILN